MVIYSVLLNFNTGSVILDIQILQLIEGARQARGLTVVIDVFRAFSVECYAMAGGAKAILPVGDIQKAYRMKAEHTDCLLVGERGGMRCEGFDCGNSPSELEKLNLTGKIIVHTTSAGTQGIANAKDAEEILTGSLVNAEAIVKYILARWPERVSLVCMGLEARTETEEDTLCAQYIKARLLGKHPDISREIDSLRETSGKKFFDPLQQTAFPQPDFEMCTRLNCFPFVLRVNREGGNFRVEKVVP